MSITPLDKPNNLQAEKIEALKDLFPQAFSDGKLNIDALKEELGDLVDELPAGEEHYGLNWPGKRDAKKLATKPPTGTLKPVPGEGVNEDTTKNLIIEGDNLEVLRIMQKAYAGRVKMIYIDPPYNTGNDFVYKDDFKEPVESYLRKSGQADEEGLLVANPKASGRFHSNWLNMMYPRLRLARNLLKDDGVIFVSIDDNEAHNLKMLLDEVFGEENYLSSFYIQVRYEGKTLVEDMNFQKLIEIVHAYGKGPAIKLNKPVEDYSIEKFKWKVVEKSQPESIVLGSKKVDIFQEGQYEIVETEPSTEGLKEIWATGKILDGNSSGRFFRDYLSGRYDVDGYNVLYKVEGVGDDQFDYRYFTGPKRVGATKGKYYQGVPVEKIENIDSLRKELPIINFHNFADSFGNCRHEGGVDFRSGKKPVRFINELANLVLGDDEDIVLDFFAGSGTTAHAVFERNYNEGNKHMYILVQLPVEAEKSDYKTISQITKERARNIAAQYRELDFGGDLGFRVFRLDQSNFRKWSDFEGSDPQALGQLFESLQTPFVDGWTPEGVLTEVMLTEGFPLDSEVSQAEGFAGKVQQVKHPELDLTLLLCLDETLEKGVVQALAGLENTVFVCRESALTDALKLQLADVITVKTL